MQETFLPEQEASKLGQRVSRELDQAKIALSGLGPAVAIYGGARVPSTHPYFAETVRLAHALSEAGLHVISGGGPGIMEAANRGAQLGGRGKSVGLNIMLPFEQLSNTFQDVSLTFETFAARKIAFCAYSHAFIAMPGGVGTLDELFEVFTLVQTNKSPSAPLILYDSSFWSGLMNWLKDTVTAQGLMSPTDLQKRVYLVDSVEEVLRILDVAGVRAPASLA